MAGMQRECCVSFGQVRHDPQLGCGTDKKIRGCETQWRAGALGVRGCARWSAGGLERNRQRGARVMRAREACARML
ncbi:hypothetical protein SKAU_G00283570 [Synaphobranchus kaupii]|uniref:Uncharacterized protein n=1 Tax=Synaphobranchus kaupii TaxID=118154 RepID=A0A9Q1EXK7_SYNKA|nr:hypothetical protein SKAU_G00283570 [Synaphobranchus kaupii]